ncbi:unnamed protein product [Owenia fusiformis]|uniref:Uncharacterized protein n=1 Tax=Owenia fusiformis TaxID=6347 RepID=A0A8J1TEC9_OWEFU|nr:unnamed protein product [Owenia fusiformis]
MTSLLCVKRPGGLVDVHNASTLDRLISDANDHTKTMRVEKTVLRQNKTPMRPHTSPSLSQHANDMDTNTLIGQSMKVQDWLNERTIQNVQERADQEAKSTRKLYDDLLHTENTFVRDVDEYLLYKKVLEERKKELLHKKWAERVHEPIRQQIVNEMNSFRYKELEKRKRELYKEYLEFTNKKGHVFLDTIAPDEYFALALHPSRPAPLKAETSHLRDPLISQARERHNEERAIMRCMTGATYRDRDLEAVKLPPLPLVPQGRHGTECKTWLEMPLNDIESPIRHASRMKLTSTLHA